MTCETWNEQLDAFIDGELLPGQMEAMNAHVASCHGCSATALAAVRMKQATRDAGRRWSAPADLRRQVLKPKPRVWRPSLVWAPMAAALVIGVLGLTFYVQRNGEHRAAQELADLHVAALASANPVDVVSTDRHTVKPWFEGKVPFSLDLPEVGNSPFALVGGRMAYLRQTPGAQLIYQYEKHRISVFVFPDAPSLDLGKLASAGSDVPFQFAAWSRHGLHYIAVSDTGPDVLQQLQERFAASP